MKEVKVHFWSSCNEALSPWCCNDFALGVIMIILFYKM